MKTTIKTPVKGGWVSRNSETGKLSEVGTPKGTSRPTANSVETVRNVTDRRKAALARLVDR